MHTLCGIMRLKKKAFISAKPLCIGKNAARFPSGPVLGYFMSIALG